MSRRFVLEEEKQKIIDLYKSGTTGIEIARILKRNPGHIYQILVKFNIKCRNPSECKKKYKCNENYFEKIDTEEKAYWLGFIVADGCVSKNELIITLSSRDEQILIELKKSLKAEQPILRSVKKKFGVVKNKQNKTFNFSTLRICSTKMTDDLRRLGIISKKTFLGQCPVVENIFKRHFWRGVLDGDGWVSVYTSVQKRKYGTYSYPAIDSGICGNSFIMTEFKIFLENIGVKANISKDKTIFQIHTSGKKAKIFLDEIYKDSSLFLKRKFDNYYGFYYPEYIL